MEPFSVHTHVSSSVRLLSSINQKKKGNLPESVLLHYFISFPNMYSVQFLAIISNVEWLEGISPLQSLKTESFCKLFSPYLLTLESNLNTRFSLSLLSKSLIIAAFFSECLNIFVVVFAHMNSPNTAKGTHKIIGTWCHNKSMWFGGRKTWVKFNSATHQLCDIIMQFIKSLWTAVFPSVK